MAREASKSPSQMRMATQAAMVSSSVRPLGPMTRIPVHVARRTIRRPLPTNQRRRTSAGRMPCTSRPDALWEAAATTASSP